MAAQPETRVIGGINVTSTPLNPFRALDLVPELATLMDGAQMSNDIGMFVSLAKNLGSGKLRELLPRILAGTKMVVTENGAPLTLTLNSTEAIDMAFDGRMKLFAEVVAFALEVSFKDFFQGFAQIGQRFQTRTL